MKNSLLTSTFKSRDVCWRTLPGMASCNSGAISWKTLPSVAVWKRWLAATAVHVRATNNDHIFTHCKYRFLLCRCEQRQVSDGIRGRLQFGYYLYNVENIF